MFVKRVEIELTSHCNAACPGCRRTDLLNKGEIFPLIHLDENTLFERFSQISLKGFLVFLCGVLGDPLMHPKIFAIIEWFLLEDSRVLISTNASLRSKGFWKSLGKLSSQTEKLYIHFAVDGLENTNALYRVNTNYSLIEKNMNTYSQNGGRGKWVFIEFDHNRHQIEEARKKAHSLNMEFSVNRAVRNSVSKWKVSSRKNLNVYYVTHTKGTLHSKVDVFKKIKNNKINKYDPQSINCKHLHKKDFFLASDGTVWPCCYLWDEYIAKKNTFYTKINEEFPLNGWNSIYKNDFKSIFKNEFFTSLNNLWEQKHRRFEKRCYACCGEKGLLRTQSSKY